MNERRRVKAFFIGVQQVKITLRAAVISGLLAGRAPIWQPYGLARAAWTFNLGVVSLINQQSSTGHPLTFVPFLYTLQSFLIAIELRIWIRWLRRTADPLSRMKGTLQTSSRSSYNRSLPFR